MSSRIESSLLKRTMQVLLALAMALYFAPGLLLAPQKAWAADGTAIVSNLADLQTAITNSSVNKIVVTTTIDLPNGTDIDGGNKTIQVEIPYVDEAGSCPQSGYSSHNVFTVNSSGAVVTLKNMTIYGGKAYGGNAGGISVNSGTLKAEGVTIARSYRGLYIGTSAKASLANCNIVRNVCTYGGGVECTGGTLVMDRCSLSENRSTSSSGGGGAIEVNTNGVFYANNTVIANNCSSEIGGAVNVFSASAYLMNCTVTGNATTASNATAGGGIGINTSGTIRAVNSIFLDNKRITPATSGASAVIDSSDIGFSESSESCGSYTYLELR